MTEMILLSEAQMARISPFFTLSHGIPRVDDRRVISGIIFVIRNGLRWRDAPKDYGPHIFHTNSEDVVSYLSRFTQWRPYEHRVLAESSKGLVPIPINRTTLNTLYGLNVWSRTLMVHYFPMVGRMRYGAGTPRERHNDSGGSSSGTA